MAPKGGGGVGKGGFAAKGTSKGTRPGKVGLVKQPAASGSSLGQRAKAGSFQTTPPWAKGQGKKDGRQHELARAEGTDNPGDKGPRERISLQRITGTLVEWRGPFGWIQPDSPIQHAMAKKRGGKVYLDQIDVEQELEGIGGRVSFFVYCDGAGLGAQHVIPATGPKHLVQKTIEKTNRPAAKPAANANAAKSGSKGAGKGPGKTAKDKNDSKVGMPPDKSTRETLSEIAGIGVVVDWRGDVGWIKPEDPLDPDMKQYKKRRGMLFVHATDCDGELPLIGAQVTYLMYSDSHGLGAEMVIVLVQGDGEKQTFETQSSGEADGESVGEGQVARVKGDMKVKATVKAKQPKGKGNGKGKAKGQPETENGPSGPNLPRERIIDDPMVGEVISWKGKFGWIKPGEDIDHPEAAKHGGKLYAHIKDVVEEGQTLQKGASVQFYLFKDASGLGAEEIVLL